GRRRMRVEQSLELRRCRQLLRRLRDGGGRIEWIWPDGQGTMLRRFWRGRFVKDRPEKRRRCLTVPVKKIWIRFRLLSAEWVPFRKSTVAIGIPRFRPPF